MNGSPGAPSSEVQGHAAAGEQATRGFRPSRRPGSTPRVMANPLVQCTDGSTSWPRISIVTPCLNHAKYVEATLLSVLQQGYPNLEYVVMDGGSTDGSRQIIDRYVEYLAAFRSAADAGPYDAVQRGFAETTGEIMGWLNSDDMLHRNALWTAAEVFRTLPEVDWIMGLPTNLDAAGRTYLVANGTACYLSLPRHRWSRYRYLRGDIGTIQQESVFWRRRLWEAAGSYIDTTYKLAADLELWMRFFRHARLYTVLAPLGGFRRVENQRSQALRNLYEAEARRIVSNEPRSPVERETLRRLRRFERTWLRAPLVRGFDRVRRAYDRLFEYPPLIVYDEHAARFVLREEPRA